MHKSMTLTSPAFEENGMIPAKYTCDGDRELSPPLSISGVPEAAKAQVLDALAPVTLEETELIGRYSRK